MLARPAAECLLLQVPQQVLFLAQFPALLPVSALGVARSCQQAANSTTPAETKPTNQCQMMKASLHLLWTGTWDPLGRQPLHQLRQRNQNHARVMRTQLWKRTPQLMTAVRITRLCGIRRTKGLCSIPCGNLMVCVSSKMRCKFTVKIASDTLFLLLFNLRGLQLRRGGDFACSTAQRQHCSDGRHHVCKQKRANGQKLVCVCAVLHNCQFQTGSR